MALRFLRVGHAVIRSIQAECSKQTKNLLRWYPAVREQMFAPDNFQTHEFPKCPVETHVERRGRGIEVCTRACKRFVYTWHKQMRELVHALRTSSGRLEQTNIHIPIPTELVDCWKQRHPRPIGQLGRRAVLPVSQYSHPGTGFVGRLEYVPPSFTVDQFEKATVLTILSTTEAATRAENQKGKPVIFRVHSQAHRNAVSPQPIRPSVPLVGCDHSAALSIVIPPFQ